MRYTKLVLAAAALAAGAAAVSGPAMSAAMDPFIEQQQTESSLNEVIRLYREQKYDEAETAVRAFLKFSPTSARGYEVLGAILGQKDEPQEAMEALDTALKLDPGLASAHANRAVLLLADGRVDDARTALEKAVEVDPQLLQAHERLARIYEAEGRTDDAIRHYEIALQGPEGAEAGSRVNLGALYNARGDFARTVSLLRIWQNDRRAGPDLHRILGDALLGEDKPASAMGQYEMALAEHPDDLLLRLGHGVVLRSLGEYDKALAAFEKIAEERPELASPVVQIAETRLAMGEAEAAATEFKRALTMTDNPSPIEYRYANVLTQAGDVKAAEDIYRTMIERDGADPQSLAALAAALVRSGDAEGARKALEQATTEFPADTRSWVRLSLFLRDQGAMQDALSVAEAGLAEHPDDLTLLRIAATLARDTDDLDKAVRFGERILQANPDSIQDKFIYATLLDKAKMDGPAMKMYREVSDSQRDNWAAMNNLALVLIRNNREQEALTFARRASQLQPDNPAVKHTLGWVLFKVGSIGEAERLMSEAVEALPQVAEVHFGYADILLARAKKAEAIEHYRIGLELDPGNEEAPRVRDALARM